MVDQAVVDKDQVDAASLRPGTAGSVNTGGGGGGGGAGPVHRCWWISGGSGSSNIRYKFQ